MKEGHELKITSNVALIQGEYTLGITAEYHRLLETVFTLEQKEKKDERYTINRD